MSQTLTKYEEQGAGNYKADNREVCLNMGIRKASLNQSIWAELKDDWNELKERGRTKGGSGTSGKRGREAGGARSHRTLQGRLGIWVFFLESREGFPAEEFTFQNGHFAVWRMGLSRAGVDATEPLDWEGVFQKENDDNLPPWVNAVKAGITVL